MAGKRRPKKARAPYRKYVAGQGFVHTYGVSSTESSAHDESGLFPADSGVQVSDDDIARRLVDMTLSASAAFAGGAAPIPYPGHSMVLPWELQFLVLSKCKTIETHFMQVCRRWYIMCLPLIYRAPRLSSKNFYKFVETLVAARKQNYGQYVVDLDLSMIIQSGKNSFVAKVLRRCSQHLEHFTAPQTSFGIAPLISLRSCSNLRYLDLGLLSETVKLKQLFEAINGFQHLTHLSFPRSSIACEGFREVAWPQSLVYLKLSGGITNEFIREAALPHTIRTLEFSFCPQVDEHSIYMLLSKTGESLEYLRFYYPMPALGDKSLDYVFRYCSNLLGVQLVVDYCSKWAFSEHLLSPLAYPRPLRSIVLESSGSLGLSFKIHPDDITIAVAEDRLPCIRDVRISSRLGWDSHSSDVEDLVSVLDDRDANLYVKF
ncbi:AAL052Cp [Eremothecium gossypii ATCC 10895]|uniref:AAL052Cp n=1 Tax=Eremothecium gossypii (strain ATCC 10895 / CBS 109.51 / FGSC 9923 / NRRL Y-1056) TaxID=284811 RepID=Q75EY0_EREGS|nr:AAL052Cp [Eremothecium gossypii ATCC 10895]AAS50314.1 AAL052Cp [Eremothecium gossypii ATCC 10895]